MKKVLTFVVFIFLGTCCFSTFLHTASAAVAYSENFELGNDSLDGWTWVDSPGGNYYITTVAAPGGGSYLGRRTGTDEGFITDQVKFELANLATHTSIKISFDLYIIGHWEGNGRSRDGAFGPDKWGQSVDTPPDHDLLGTFSTKNGFYQSYPQTYTGWDLLDPLTHSNPFETGSAEDRNDTLGYTLDTVYEIEYTMPHTASSLTLYFEGVLNGNDGKWGLDNMVVELDPVPIPGSLLLLISGIVCMTGFKRKKS